jgi:hypothetical protein
MQAFGAAGADEPELAAIAVVEVQERALGGADGAVGGRPG